MKNKKYLIVPVLTLIFVAFTAIIIGLIAPVKTIEAICPDVYATADIQIWLHQIISAALWIAVGYMLFEVIRVYELIKIDREWYDDTNESKNYYTMTYKTNNFDEQEVEEELKKSEDEAKYTSVFEIKKFMDQDKND